MNEVFPLFFAPITRMLNGVGSFLRRILRGLLNELIFVAVEAYENRPRLVMLSGMSVATYSPLLCTPLTLAC